MSEAPIPDDVMKLSRNCLDKVFRAPSNVEAKRIIARAILADREAQAKRVEEAIKARRAIYEAKRDAADPFADDQFCRRDLFNHAVEAFEWLEDEISRALAKEGSDA